MLFLNAIDSSVDKLVATEQYITMPVMETNILINAKNRQIIF